MQDTTQVNNHGTVQYMSAIYKTVNMIRLVKPTSMGDDKTNERHMIQKINNIFHKWFQCLIKNEFVRSQ